MTGHADDTVKANALTLAYDYSLNLLTRQFKLDPMEADTLAKEYAADYWQDWLADAERVSASGKKMNLPRVPVFA